MNWRGFWLAVAVAACASAVVVNLPHYQHHNDEKTVVMVSFVNDDGTPKGHGTGVYIGNGRVLTAAHVAKEAPAGGKVAIQLGDGPAVAGTVQWYSTDNDVGLILLDAPLAGVQVARLSCSTPDPVVGTALESIGDPLDFINLHTWGRVAAPVANHEKLNSFIVDLTIAPGNSGGPVFNWEHELVGIAVAMASTTMSGMFPVMFPLAYIVPKSIICHELSVAHDAPVFEGSK